MSEQQGIVYSSGVIIDDESYLATLTVLYERVYLPWSPVWDSFNATSALATQQNRSADFVTRAAAAFFLWEKKWQALYEHQALERLSEPIPARTFFPPLHLKDYAAEVLKDGFANKQNTGKVINAVHIGKFNAHLHRTDIMLPQIFLPGNKPTALARSAWKHSPPSVTSCQS